MCKYCANSPSSDDIPCEVYTEFARNRQEQYLKTQIVKGNFDDVQERSNDEI